MRSKGVKKVKEKQMEKQKAAVIDFFLNYNDRLLTHGHDHKLGKKNFLLSFLFVLTLCHTIVSE